MTHLTLIPTPTPNRAFDFTAHALTYAYEQACNMVYLLDSMDESNRLRDSDPDTAASSLYEAAQHLGREIDRRGLERPEVYMDPEGL